MLDYTIIINFIGVAKKDTMSSYSIFQKVQPYCSTYFLYLLISSKTYSSPVWHMYTVSTPKEEGSWSSSWAEIETQYNKEKWWTTAHRYNTSVSLFHTFPLCKTNKFSAALEMKHALIEKWFSTHERNNDGKTWRKTRLAEVVDGRKMIG